MCCVNIISCASSVFSFILFFNELSYEFLWKTMLLNLIIGKQYCISSYDLQLYNFGTFLNVFANCIVINNNLLEVASICWGNDKYKYKKIIESKVLKLKMILKIMPEFYNWKAMLCPFIHLTIIYLRKWQEETKFSHKNS